jgi:hypothetical protein
MKNQSKVEPIITVEPISTSIITANSNEIIVTKPAKIIDENNSKKIRIKRFVKETVLNSSIHGIPNALRAENSYFKFIWIFCFLITVTTSIYLITKNLTEYLEYETVTKIRIINEQPTIFPTVSFQFNYGNLRANYSLEENIIKLYYETIILDISQHCEISKEKMSLLFKFNSGKNSVGQKINIRKQKIAGQKGGLYSEVFIGLPNQFISNISLYGTESRSSYFSLYIHNISMNPAEVNEQPIKLPPGFNTAISISKTYTDRLPYPYNDCIDDLNELRLHDSLLVQHILTKTKSIYRQKDCFNLCQAKYIIDSCSLKSSLGFTWEIDVNENKTCAGIQKDYFLTTIDINEYCAPFCPMECDSIEYKFEVMFSVFPNLDYASQLAVNDKVLPKYPNGSNITLEDLRASVVAFSIYYPDFKYTVIEQLPKMQLVDAVSNFGGLLGLFVGVSFLSFMELFECLIQIVLIGLDK